jgi:hypothetical protein
MMDPMSTQRGLARVVSRFRRLRRSCSFHPFKGVIAPSFTAWIWNHWQFHTIGWFHPVAKDFYKRKNLFDGLVWPRPHQTRVTNYTFSPTLQLTCFPQSSSNTVFEINGARVFQTLTMQLKDHSETKEAYLRVVRRERSKYAPKNVLVNESNQSSESLVFVDKAMQVEIPVAPHLRTENTRVRDLLSSLYSTVFRSVQGITRSLMTILRDLPNVTHEWKVKNNSREETARRRRLLVVDDLVRQRDSIDCLRTTSVVRRLEQTFLTVTKRSEVGAEDGFAARFFPTVALDFKAPNVAEAELINQRIAHFVSSPSLTYAKREQGLSEGIVNTLRGLRASPAEQKPVAVPQLPSIEQLTSQVRTQLERELRIEKERRGL